MAPVAGRVQVRMCGAAYSAIRDLLACYAPTREAFRRSMATYSIAPDVLYQRAAALCAKYQQAKPFPHIAIDDFFPVELAEAALAEFPKPGDIAWQRFQNSREVKLACNDEALLGPAIRDLIWQMNSQVFLRFLEQLTGIPDLIPDPQLSGGGMHQIVRGGKLGVHVDFNKHGAYQLDRRLNLLLYLNKDWREEYGGHLELWDEGMTRCEQRILPVFNRVALFSTTEKSWHGHPNALACPEGWSRKSIALYYYTNGRSDGSQASAHSTVFRERPGEALPKESGEGLRLRDFVPPILWRGMKRLAGR
jgi:hypothetical protein